MAEGEEGEEGAQEGKGAQEEERRGSTSLLLPRHLPIPTYSSPHILVADPPHALCSSCAEEEEEEEGEKVQEEQR
jgi:hypothetical protein